MLSCRFLCCPALVVQLNQVDQFQARKQSELRELTGQLADLQTSIASTQQMLATALSQQAAAAGDALGAAQSSHADSAQKLAAALQAAGKSMAAAFDSLSGSLSAQGTQLAAFVQEQQAATAAAQQAAAAGFTRAQDSLASISSAVQRLDSLAGSSTVAVGDRLAAFASDFESSMAVQQQQLLAQVGSLLSAFVADRQSAVAGAVADMQQRLTEGRQQVAQEACGLTAAADSCVSTLQVRLRGAGKRRSLAARWDWQACPVAHMC